MGDAATPEKGRHARLLIVFAIAVATFAAALPNGLLGDDVLLLEARLEGSRASSLTTLFFESYWGDLHDSGLYRPLSLALLSGQRSAFGSDPAPYRIVNLILHGLCSILVMRLLARFIPGRPAFWGALLFAVHPIHAEAVTTIYGQQDLLAAVFFLAALVIAVEFDAARSLVRTSTVSVLYLLSLLSKEQGVLLPLLLPLLPHTGTSGEAGHWFRFRRAHLALLVPLIVYTLLRVGALGSHLVPSGEASVVYGYPWWARLNLAIVTVGTYIRLLILPWGQTTYYGHLRDSLFGHPLLEILFVLMAVVLFRPLQHGLGPRVVGVAFAFLAVTLLPVANLLPLGIVVAERCLYLPVFSVCLLTAAGIQRVTEERRRIVIALVSALVAAGLILSARVAYRWRTPLIHWQTTAADHPRSAGAHARFALLLLHEAAADGARLDDPRLARAEQSIERASQINRRLPEAWQARGVLALMRGDCTTAALAFDHALALRPSDRQIASLRRKCP